MANFNVELNSKPVRNTSEYTLLLRITVVKYLLFIRHRFSHYWQQVSRLDLFSKNRYSIQGRREITEIQEKG